MKKFVRSFRQSENLLLKLFNQGANTTGQFDSVSAKTEDIVAASSQFASMSIGNPNSQVKKMDLTRLE